MSIKSKGKHEKSRINVFVRCKTFLPTNDSNTIATVSFPSDEEVILNDDVQNVSFKFDHVFNPEAQNSEVFSVVGEPLLNSLMSGVNGSLMTYGQTATGKSHTMFSESDGLIISSTRRLFQLIEACSKYSHQVTFSFLQIYQDKIYDLLSEESKRSLSLREHPKEGVVIESLIEEVSSNSVDVQRLLGLGKQRRVVVDRDQYLQNRSHVICILKIEKFKKCIRTTSSDTIKDLTTVKSGKMKAKLFLCDLAGSERLRKSGISRRQLEETRYINTSLLEFGNVIHALTSKSRLYVPFRNSTLTRILKESLNGTSKTSLMVCISPYVKDFPETKYSLNFGQRATKVVKRAAVSRTDTHWLNYPLFKRRKNRKIDYRALAEYLTNKLKDLENAYNQEKDNLRRLKHKLSKKSMAPKHVDSETESCDSTPSKISENANTKKLSILHEEPKTNNSFTQTSLDHGLDDLNLNHEKSIHGEINQDVSTNSLNDKKSSAMEHQQTSTATQTITRQNETVASQTSYSNLTVLLHQTKAFLDKSVNTSTQSLNENYKSDNNKTSIKSNTTIASQTSITDLRFQIQNKLVSRSVNTSLKSMVDSSIQTTERYEQRIQTSASTLCDETLALISDFDESVKITDNNNNEIDSQPHTDGIMQSGRKGFPVFEKLEEIISETKSISTQTETDSSMHGNDDEKRNDLIRFSMVLEQENTFDLENERSSETNKKEADNYVPTFPETTDKDANDPEYTLVSFEELNLVSYDIADVDNDVVLKEAKVLTSPTTLDYGFVKKIGQTSRNKSLDVSPCSSYPHTSIDSELENIYREDTRHAKKSLKKVQHRYSQLLHQLNELTSELSNVDTDATDGIVTSDGECFDIVLKFKAELEEELGKAKQNLKSTATETNQQAQLLLEGMTDTNHVEDSKEAGAILNEEKSGDLSIADVMITPSGTFEDDYVMLSRQQNHGNDGNMQTSSSYLELSNDEQPMVPCTVIEDQACAVREFNTQIDGHQSDNREYTEDKVHGNMYIKTSLDGYKEEEKSSRQRKLTLAAIENAEIKKELLLTKLEKLRLEAVLSCVLIDTETNDMTKEFQKLSVRSKRGLTSSKSTLASATSCAHLPSLSSASTFHSLQSPIKKYSYKERFCVPPDYVATVQHHQLGQQQHFAQPSYIASPSVTRSVQTERNVSDWLNSDLVKKQTEEASCQSSSDFDVSSMSDLGSPLPLTARRLSPCGQDKSPYLTKDFVYETDFDDIDNLLMRYKKKKTSAFSLSCFNFLRGRKQKTRASLQGAEDSAMSYINQEC